MNFLVCITTRNRPAELKLCLQALFNSKLKPYKIIVSDDSQDEMMQRETRLTTSRFAGVKYIIGPKKGVCANRNNALRSGLNADIDLVSFIDDDICVESDFFEVAIQHYNSLSAEQRDKLILSGVSDDGKGHKTLPTRLSFRGYFIPTQEPECVAIHAAVFPASFLRLEQWDEDIYFGYEDAELCLRALRYGCKILQCPDLKVTDVCFNKGTLKEKKVGGLTEYELYIEAARLYVGIKRYYSLQPNMPKLFMFTLLYFSHMTIYLIKNRALSGWPIILKNSNISEIFRLPTQSIESTSL